jgi:hypothetical protein
MNLHEQLNRTKELMGLQPLNEGIFRQKGKFKDFLRKLFKKDNGEEILDDVNKYEEKYGTELGNETYVDSVKLLRTIQTRNNNETSFEQFFTVIGILTDSPVELTWDNTKKTSRVSFIVKFQKKEGKNITMFYEYGKFLYFIDGEQTDEISQIREGKNFTCGTNTLEGKTGGCNLSQEVRDEILKSYENTPDYEIAKTYLDKIQ